MSWKIDPIDPGVVAVVAAIAAQTGGVVWWMAGTEQRIRSLETAIVSVEPQSERIVRLETKMDYLTQTLDEIKHMLGRKP